MIFISIRSIVCIPRPVDKQGDLDTCKIRGLIGFYFLSKPGYNNSNNRLPITYKFILLIMYSDVMITLSVRLSHGLRVHLLGLEQCLQLSVLIIHLSAFPVHYHNV